MNKKEGREIMNQVWVLYAEAQAALDRGDIFDMEHMLRELRDVLDDCYDRSTEEAPDTVLEQMRVEGEKRYSDAEEAANQKQDDAEEKESTDEKGRVVDEPHQGHCVPS